MPESKSSKLIVRSGYAAYADSFVSGSLTLASQSAYLQFPDGTKQYTAATSGTFSGSIDTGSFLITSSYSGSYLTFEKGDHTTYSLYIPTGGLETSSFIPPVVGMNRFILSGSSMTVNEGSQDVIYDLYVFGTASILEGTQIVTLGNTTLKNDSELRVEKLYNAGIINNGGLLHILRDGTLS